jgi:GT2 family glycosyltransferase
LIWDNGSVDRSKEIIESAVNEIGVDVKKHYHESNVGFAPAHTALFNLSDSRYIFTLNQDTLLESDVLEKLIVYLDKNSSVASAGPVILRLENGRRTKVVDSLGLEIKKSRKAVDLGAGSDYHEISSEPGKIKPVFGVTAAAAIYVREAVKKVSRTKELFDVSYLSYQEDIDLAWRLRLGGFESVVLTDTIVYHNRSIRDSSGRFVDKISGKRNQPLFIRKQSYKNHLATIIKNEQWQNFTLDFIFIFWYEGMKLIYNILFDREVFQVLKEVWNDRFVLLEERQRIKSITRESWRDIGRWWV